MKYFKRIFYLLVIFAIIASIGTFGLLKIEDYQTSYLKIENQADLSVNSYLIKNTNIIPMTADTVLMNKTVLIVDGVIKKIGNDISSSGEKIIDGKGGYITPGLIDMHVHVWDKFELGLYLANGVTTVRNLLGMPFHLNVKNEINLGELIGPTFYTTSPQFTGINDKSIEKRAIETPAEAVELVKKYKKEGYDYIKTYNRLPKDIFDATIEQGVASDIPIVSHPSFKVDYDYHFSSGISTIEHTEDIVQQPLDYALDSTKIQPIIDGYANSQQSHCPTLTVYYNITEIYNKEDKVLTTEQAGYINPFFKSVYMGDYEYHMGKKESDSTATKRVNDQHNFHIYIIRKLHEAGVNIVCGTDAGVLNTAPGFSIHQELAFYQQAGMSAFEALKTATVNPKKVYSEYTKYGTIENGNYANLILTYGNPLQDLTFLKNPEFVMIKGRIVDKPLMKEFKQKAYQRSNYMASMIRMLKYVLWGK